MYACGITVYDLCHVGHARMMVAFDVIARHLRASGFEVNYVRNVTDVDDKIIRKAEAESARAAEVAREFTDKMNEDMRALGRAPRRPRAARHRAHRRGRRDHRAAREEGPRLRGGRRRLLLRPGLRALRPALQAAHRRCAPGARIEVDEQKKSPLDFALWKAAKPGEPSWPSPWGHGRPGWHIECSAMAHRYLGEPFDIHGGGADLIFPHHENEIAQSQGAYGDGQFARHWMHTGFVNFGGEKMSKSLGNFVTIRKVAETYDLEALRLHLIGVHYRSPLGVHHRPRRQGARPLPGARRGRARLEYSYRTIDRLAAAPGEDDGGAVAPPADKTLALFNEAMDDDFNTAAAVGHLSEAFLLANKLLDEPGGGRQGRPPPDARPAAQGPRRLRRDAGDLPAPPAAFLDAYRLRLCGRRGHRSGRRRGAHRRARRRP